MFWKCRITVTQFVNHVFLNCTAPEVIKLSISSLNEVIKLSISSLNFFPYAVVFHAYGECSREAPNLPWDPKEFISFSL
jgi:hypothetical protein